MSLPKGRQRARSAEDKAGRETALIAAARTALSSRAYDEVTMADVAARVGLTKASAYNYFATKEALFLRLIEAELAAWFLKLEAELSRSRSSAATAVAKLLARSLTAEPVLLELLTLLHGRIEPNLPDTDILRFKSFLATSLARTGAALEAKLALPQGAGAKLLLRTHAITIGLRQMSNPPEAVRRIIAANAMFDGMTPDFEQELSSSIADWIAAWRSK